MRLDDSWGEDNRPSDMASGGDAIERLLRSAADFEPDIQPVNDFVRVALRRREQRGAGRLRPYVVAFSSGFAAILIVGLVMSRAGLLEPNLPPPSDIKGPGLPPPLVGSNDGGARAANEMSGSTKPAGTTGGAAVVVRPTASTGRNTDPAARRPVLFNASSERPRAQSRSRTDSIPKVRWHNEVVQRYDRGVIEPAYVVEERDGNGDTVYKPVMMPVTTETGARPVLVDGMPDTSIQLTSLSEETSQR